MCARHELHLCPLQGACVPITTSCVHGRHELHECSKARSCRDQVHFSQISLWHFTEMTHFSYCRDQIQPPAGRARPFSLGRCQNTEGRFSRIERGSCRRFPKMPPAQMAPFRTQAAARAAAPRQARGSPATRPLALRVVLWRARRHAVGRVTDLQ